MPRAAHPAGEAGEELAARFLKKSGYKILQRRYTCALGEIDIIALDGDQIVFVEVKSGASDAFAPPEAHVTLDKQRRISRVARHYCARKRITDVACRFDVVAVLMPPDADPTITLYKSAFPLRAR